MSRRASATLTRRVYPALCASIIARSVAVTAPTDSRATASAARRWATDDASPASSSCARARTTSQNDCIAMNSTSWRAATA